MGSGKMGSFNFQVAFLTGKFMKIIVFVPFHFSMQPKDAQGHWCKSRVEAVSDRRVLAKIHVCSIPQLPLPHLAPPKG
jgi:hypothetical protein